MKINIIVATLLFLFVADNCYGQDKKNDQDANNYIAQAKSYLQLGEKQAALRAFQKAIELDYDNADVHLDVAKIYANFREYNKAVEELKISIKLDSTLVSSISPHLAIIQVFQENTDGLKKTLQKLESKDHYVYGVIYDQIILARAFGLQESTRGLFDLEIPLPNQTTTDYQTKLESKIFDLKKNNEIQKAIKMLETFLSNPASSQAGQAHALNEMGNIYYQSVNRIHGIEYLEKAIKIFPNYVYWRQELATKLISTQLYNQALSEIEKIFIIEPKNNFAYLAQGVIYMEFGFNEKAVLSWNQLKQQDKILFVLVEDDYIKLKNDLENKK